MGDLTNGIGNNAGMNDINNVSANNTANTTQPSGYSNSQSGYSSTSSYDSASNYGSSSSNYGGYSSTASYSDFGTKDTDFVSLLKGILGAVVGAIPGIILIILLARAGFIAAICGALMAGGMFFGYKFMTKNNPPSEMAGIVICGVVMLIGVYIAVRTSWCMEIAKVLQDELGFAAGEVDKFTSEVLYEYIGIRDVSFSEISSEFGTLLDKVDLKGKFIWSFLENLIFAVAGGYGAFSKFGNGSISI
ncbi:MAG: hypothetical protein K6G33_12945 [Ruminococcus sp.]|uniref:hypothetical protein n=1 Tax=Ruminococcus sp. TaxID=41978 RepID=UPI0025DF6EE9|nr:hypothetical protein [Ruminococcus sp.]MCR5601637.1 hypothetical protein [Ruminococcus sp.]